MTLSTRQMKLEEAHFVVDYFHRSTPEHLEMLGVDPTRLPPYSKWLEYFKCEYAQPIDKRSCLVVLWLSDDVPVGFSSVDRIVFGKEAFMHLHILDSDRRKSGIGTTCVRESARIYFDALGLERLFCEPNAFNVAPNRTLQSAGFKYVKTHKTVPGPLNYHQAVTRWILEKHQL